MIFCLYTLFQLLQRTPLAQASPTSTNRLEAAQAANAALQCPPPERLPLFLHSLSVLACDLVCWVIAHTTRPFPLPQWQGSILHPRANLGAAHPRPVGRNAKPLTRCTCSLTRHGVNCVAPAAAPVPSSAPEKGASPLPAMMCKHRDLAWPDY